MLKISTLSYKEDVDRYCIETMELHCGQCFEIENNGQWESVRIEINGNGWYLIGTDKSIDEIYTQQIQVRIDM